RRVELLGQCLVRAAGPRATEAAGEFLAGDIGGPRDREDAPSFIPNHLGNDVGRRAETVEAEAHAASRGVERAVSDQPGAEQRCRLHVTVRAIYWKAESGVGNRVLGVPTVDVVAG